MFEFPEPKLAGVGALTEETEQSYHLIPNFVFAPMHSFGFPLHLYWPNGVGKRRFETVWLGADWGAGERPPEWQSYIEGYNVILHEDIAFGKHLQNSLDSAGFDGANIGYWRGAALSFSGDDRPARRRGQYP